MVCGNCLAHMDLSLKPLLPSCANGFLSLLGLSDPRTVRLQTTLREMALLSRRSPTSSARRFWQSGLCEKLSSCSTFEDIVMWVLGCIVHACRVIADPYIDNLPVRYGHSKARQLQRDLSLRGYDLHQDHQAR